MRYCCNDCNIFARGQNFLFLIFLICFYFFLTDGTQFTFNNKEMQTHIDALRDLVPLYNFKNVKNTRGRVLLLIKLHAKSLQLY